MNLTRFVILGMKYTSIPYIILDNFTIDGQVNIEVEITEPTTNISLHIYDMTIHEEEVTLTNLNGDTNVNIVGHGYDEFRQFYIINFKEVNLEMITIDDTVLYTGAVSDKSTS